MVKKKTDTQTSDAFPPPPFPGSNLLQPLTSWSEMHKEMIAQGVEFDEFWFEQVHEGGTYFYRWLGEPRSTVLLIWDERTPIHLECRRTGDALLTAVEVAPIIAEIEYGLRRPECGH